MNEPKLRFPEFTDDWKQHKLGELGSLKNGMNFSKEAMGIGFPFVNLQNIFGNNVVDVSNLGKAMASESQLKDYNLINGDVLFVRSSVKLEGVGEAAVIPCTLKDTTYSGFIIRFRDEYGLDNDFKRFVFGIESVRNQIMSQATNSANKNISQPVLENLKLAIPSKLEQQKLGVLFSNLDTLIQSAEKELDGYRELKQGMLQKMFPKKGEKVPEIRFPEFTGDWEQHKLGEVAPLRGGYAFKSDKYKTEGTPIVRISNILSDGSVGAEFAYYDDIEDDEKCTLGNGDALLAMSGATTGKVSILKCNNNDKYYQNQRVGYFERNEQYNYGFVSTIVRSDLFKEQLTLVLVAGAQPNVSSKEIDAFEFMFPNSIVEQKKIGEYFSNLDNLIALQQQELDGYKELKKGLLQQMFC